MIRSGSNYLYDCAILRADSVCIVPVFTRKTKIYVNENKQQNSRANLKQNRTKGVLSKASAKKLKNAVNTLIASAFWKKVFVRGLDKTIQFKVNFITLTLSGSQLQLFPKVAKAQVSKLKKAVFTSYTRNCPLTGVYVQEFTNREYLLRCTDNYVKRHLLGAFVKELKRQFGLKSYVWKAEAQRNGNIHFHITTDLFIHYEDVRRIWNKVQKQHSLLENYYEVYGHYNPNSTDVHATKHIKNLSAYLVKYMSKNSIDRRIINGSLWGCSDNLKLSCEIEVIEKVQCDELLQLYEIKDNKVIDSDFFEYHILHYSKFPPGMKKAYYRFLDRVRKYDSSDKVRKEKIPKRINEVSEVKQVSVISEVQLKLF